MVREPTYSHAGDGQAIYSVRRRFLFLWQWTVERGGKKVRSGVAFSKMAARFGARTFLRAMRTSNGRTT